MSHRSAQPPGEKDPARRTWWASRPRRKPAWAPAGPVRGSTPAAVVRGLLTGSVAVRGWHCPRAPCPPPPPRAAGRGGAGPVSSERGALTAIQNVAQPRASLIWEMRGLLAACCSRLSFLNVFSSPCQSCRDARSPWKPLVKISCSVLIIEFQPSRARSLWAAERRPGGKAAPTPVAAAGPPSAPCGESGLGQWLRALE